MHDDPKNSRIGLTMWFGKESSQFCEVIKEEGKFILCNYGIFIQPTNDTIIILNTTKMSSHGIMKSISFMKMGISSTTKEFVLKHCKKHMRKLPKKSL